MNSIYKIGTFVFITIFILACGSESEDTNSDPSANGLSTGLSQQFSCHTTESDRNKLSTCAEHPAWMDSIKESVDALKLACNQDGSNNNSIPTYEIKDGPCPQANLAGTCTIEKDGLIIRRIFYYYNFSDTEQFACKFVQGIVENSN